MKGFKFSAFLMILLGFCIALFFSSPVWAENSPEKRFQEAVQLSEQGKEEEALLILEELIHTYPELPEPYNNAAVIYAKKGEWQKAQNALETAIAAHPHYQKAYENLGYLYLARAKAAFQKAGIPPSSFLKDTQ